MTKTRKIILALLLAAVMTMSLITVVACSNKAVTGIEITTPPTKTSYLVGERFNPEGMVVSVVYENGKTKALKEDKYTYSPTGALDANNRSITVFYEIDGQTYKATQSITVHNKVVSGEIKSNPTKTTYIPGQRFDPSGMVVAVKYENGKQEQAEITAGNASFSTAALTEEDTAFIVTYQGYNFTVTLDFMPGVYIEAESGVFSGNARVSSDATPKDDVLGEWDDKYLASGGEYVADLSAGDKLSIVFESDKAGTGDVTIRLAGKRLLLDQWWTPIWVGDCQFNKICKMYINHEEYDIADSVVLPGGGGPGCEPNFYLWFNWQDVTLENVALCEGINVVTFEFIRHPYTCSQEAFNNTFGANVDSVTVISEDCKVTSYTGSMDDIDFNSNAKISYKATAASIAQENDKAVVIVDGTYIPIGGVSEEEIISFLMGILLDFQGNPHMDAYLATGETGVWDGDWEFNAFYAFEVTLGDGTYTAKYDVTRLRAYSFTAHYGGRSGEFDFKPPMDEYSNTITIGEKRYTLSYAPDAPNDGSEDFFCCVGLHITEGITNLAYEATAASIAQEDDKAVVIVTGTFERPHNANDADIIKFIKKIMLDFQGNPHMQTYFETGDTGNWSGDWNAYPFYAFDVILGDNTFTAKYDVTSLRTFSFTAHYGGDTDEFDFKPPMDEYNQSIIVGGKKYTLSYVPNGGTEDFYGCVGLHIEEDYAITRVTLEEKNGKPYLVIIGKYEGTNEAFEARLSNIYADILNIPNYSVNPEWTNVSVLKKGETLLIEINDDGTFKLYLDLTSDKVESGWALFAHLSLPGNDPGKNFTNGNVELTAVIVVDGLMYYFQDTRNTGDWDKNLVVIKVIEAL